MNGISRSSKLPLYYQLYQILRNQIRDGVWQPDDMLPGEVELMAQYQLSRATVRQALDMLANEGLIQRRRGQGTYVSRPTIEQNLSRIISFWEDMQQRGLEPSTKVISSELIPATGDIANALNVQAGEEIASLVRLRLADNEAMSVEHSYLVHKLCPGVMKQDYANHSLRGMLVEKYNIHLVYARQKIRAVRASRSLAQILSVNPGDPLLYMERVSYSDLDVPIELLHIHHRGDRYTFFTELRN
jgi:GntR family transcriptional regulator, N-acetylglucosamine utilization regulator